MIFPFFLEIHAEPENFRYEQNKLIWNAPKTANAQGYLLSWRNKGETCWKKVRNGGAIPPERTYFENPKKGLEYQLIVEVEEGFGNPSQPVFVAGKHKI